MRYRDTVAVYEPITTIYSQEPQPDRGQSTIVQALVVASNTVTASAYYDQMTGDAYAYVPADEPYVIANHSDLRGKFVEYGDTIYRVEESAIGDHKLTTGKPMFVRLVLSATAHELEAADGS